MDAPARITALVENTVYQRGLLAEHGLSFLIETGGRRVLFDTGQGGVLRHNAEQLGVDLKALDAIVLSHGHDDHTGGLRPVIEGIPRAPVFAHPRALHGKFVARPKAKVESIGMPAAALEALSDRPGETVATPSITEVVPGVRVTGEIPRRNGFEDTGGKFFLDAMAQEADPLTDDQALLIDTPRGLVLIVGCSHAGIVNTMDHVADLAGARKLHAVIGGMHLLRASQERFERTAEAFARHAVEVLAPCHCTGTKAQAFLRSRFPNNYFDCPAGTAFQFDA